MASRKKQTGPTSAGGRPKHPTIDKLLKGGVTRSVKIIGYAHEGPTADVVRIYLSLEDLSTYFDVPANAILEEKLPTDALDPATFLVARDAVITLSFTSVASQQAALFDGPISAERLRAIRHFPGYPPPHPTGSFTPLCVVREE